MPSRTSRPGPISAPSTPRPIPAAAPSSPPRATTSCRRPSPVEPAADLPTASTLPARPRPTSEREQLDLFRALPGDLAPRDAQDLMAYPFFSLAKSKRLAPIDFKAGSIVIRVEAVPEHGMATIWAPDVPLCAAHQNVAARARPPPAP